MIVDRQLTNFDEADLQTNWCFKSIDYLHQAIVRDPQLSGLPIRSRCCIWSGGGQLNLRGEYAELPGEPWFPWWAAEVEPLVDDGSGFDLFWWFGNHDDGYDDPTCPWTDTIMPTPELCRDHNAKLIFKGWHNDETRIFPLVLEGRDPGKFLDTVLAFSLGRLRTECSQWTLPTQAESQ